MKALLLRLLRADRKKVVAILCVTRAEAGRCVEHARGGAGNLPIWCFCAEHAEALAGCDRFFSGVTASDIRRELRETWPALLIAAWTGQPGNRRYKLEPFTFPPFRVLLLNEAGDFFSGPAGIASHVARRLRDSTGSMNRRFGDIAFGGDGFFNEIGGRIWRFFHGRVVMTFANHGTGAFLIAIASVADGALKLPSRLFKRFHRHRHLSFAAPLLPQITVIEIPINVRRWHSGEIARAVEASNASVIVFREHGDGSDARDLLELVRRPDVFAAARQIHHTDWRSKLVSKYPFRRLQPGEISRTLVLYSTLIAFRRDVLLQLGIPRVKFAGSAYLLLCWQASAAGLASVSAGVDDAVSTEPDVPAEQLEFVAHLLRSKALRELAPMDEDLCHGNISTQIAGRKPFRGKLRVLVVSPYLPFPLSHGGAVRIFNLCRALEPHVDFVLACFRETGDVVRYDILHGVFREVHVVDIDEKHAEGDAPNQVAGYRNSGMRALIGRLAESHCVDLLQIEYTQMAEYRDAAGNTPALLVEHDVTFTLHEQLCKTANTPAARQQYERWLRFESAALKNFDAVWTMSGQDRDLATSHGAPAGRTDVVPNGVDLDRFQPQPKTSTEPRILFVGAWRHLPNVLALEWLRMRIMPSVWARVPNAMLHVIGGPDHARHAEAAGKATLLAPDARVTLEGYVEDVRAAYRECDVVAIPLPVSAGTNIKLLEAMASGRPVVSTPVGCQGLLLDDGDDLFVRELNDSFADAIVDLLLDRRLRAAIAQHARRTAELRFGWNAIAQEALRSYAGIAVQPELLTLSGDTLCSQSRL